MWTRSARPAQNVFFLGPNGTDQVNETNQTIRKLITGFPKDGDRQKNDKNESEFKMALRFVASLPDEPVGETETVRFTCCLGERRTANVTETFRIVMALAKIVPAKRSMKRF